MINDIVFNGIKVFNPIEDKIDKIIEYFVDYYGEEHRQKIVERINDTTFIFLPKLGKDEDIMEGKKVYDTISNIRAETKKQRELLKIELNQKYFPPNVCEDILPNDVVEIYKKIEGGEKLSQQNKNIVKAFANGLYLKPLSFFGFNKYSRGQTDAIKKRIEEYCEELKNEYSPRLEKLYDESDLVVDKIKQYIPDIDEIMQREKADIDEIKLKYFKDLLKMQNVDATNDEIKKYFPAYSMLQDDGRLYLQLHDANERKAFVELFKFLKIGRTDDYQYYYNNSSCFDATFFSLDLKSDIYKRRAQSYRERNHKNDILQYAYEKISALDIKYKPDKDNIIKSMADFATNNTAGFVAHYIDGADNLKMVCVCEDYFSLSTQTVFHEIQHIIDSEILEDKEEYYCVKCGVDVTPHEKHNRCSFIGINRSYVNRDAKMIDEILTEHFSEQVCQNATNDGFFVAVGDNYSSTYRAGFPVFDKLIKSYEYTLMRARQVSDPQMLEKAFGYSNITSLYSYADEVLKSSAKKSISAIWEILTKKGVSLSGVANYVDTYENKSWSNDAKNYLLTIKKVNAIVDEIAKYKQTSNEIEKEL